MAIEVTASNVEQLYGKLEDAYIDKTEEYIITLDSTLPYEVNSYRARSSTYNPSPGYPYGPPGTERSSLPQIWSKVTIKAADGMLATITRDPDDPEFFRHFYVKSDGELTLERIIIEKGDVGSADTGGGAILNKGILNINNCKLGPDNKSNYGGAILNLEGNATLVNCDIFGNEADWGGGLYNGFASAVMTLTNCRIAENKSLASWAVGGGIANMSGTLNIEHCSVFANEAGLGGGIAAYGSNGVNVQNSIIRENSGNTEGGGLYTRDGGTITAQCSTITSNSSPNGPVGYIHSGNGTIELENCALPLFDIFNQSTIIGNIPFGDISTPLPPRYPEFFMSVQTNATLLPIYLYNREKVASLAIEQSQDNLTNTTSFPSTLPTDNPSDVSANAVRGVGGEFTYSYLSHSSGATGSATFISEAFYAGGVPMQIDNQGAGVCSQDDKYSTESWRICCGSPNLEATRSWREHEALLGFFVNVHNATSLSSNYDQSDTIDYNVLTTYMRFDTAGGGSVGGGQWRAGEQQNGEDYLYGLFDIGGPLAHLDTGDLVWLDQSDTSHSFVIVGWGPALECPDSLNAQVGTFHIERTHSGNEIPYVADFCYAYGDLRDSTGWLQDPRPRPFYCNAALINDSQLTTALNDLGYSGNLSGYKQRLGGIWERFTFNSTENPVRYWRFFHIPDQLYVEKEEVYCLDCS